MKKISLWLSLAALIMINGCGGGGGTPTATTTPTVTPAESVTCSGACVTVTADPGSSTE